MVPKFRPSVAASALNKRLLRKSTATPRTQGDGSHTFLERNAVGLVTRPQYDSLMGELTSFGKLFQVDFTQTTPVDQDVEKIDECLVEFADQAFFEDQPSSYGDRIAAALYDWWPAFGKRGCLSLPRFGRARQGWGRLAPGTTRDGLPWLSLCLSLNYLKGLGHKEVCLALLTMFVCYFRPSELLSLEVQDLVKPTRSIPHFALLLHPQERGVSSKTGEWDDGLSLSNRFCPALGQLLSRWAQKRPTGSPMFAMDYRHLRQIFMQGMEELGLGVPSLYRLRHGGASSDYAMGHRPLLEIKRRGRWRADSSLRRYEKSTRAQAVEGRLSKEQQSRATVVALELHLLLDE